MSRLTDDTKVINEFISQKLPNLLPSIVTLVGSLIMLFILDWKMTLLTFITIPIFVLIMIPLGRIMQKISTSTQSEIANFSGLLGRVLTEMRLVKISNTERLELDNAHKNLNEIYKLGLKQAKIAAVVQTNFRYSYVANNCNYFRFWCIRNCDWCNHCRYINCNDILCYSVIYAFNQSFHVSYRL